MGAELSGTEERSRKEDGGGTGRARPRWASCLVGSSSLIFSRYFISAQWLSEWKMFVLNKESKELAPRMSPNREIGVLPPGPVSNMKLLREGDNNPRDFRVKAGL